MILSFTTSSTCLTICFCYTFTLSHLWAWKISQFIWPSYRICVCYFVKILGLRILHIGSCGGHDPLIFKIQSGFIGLWFMCDMNVWHMNVFYWLTDWLFSSFLLHMILWLKSDEISSIAFWDILLTNVSECTDGCAHCAVHTHTRMQRWTQCLC